MADITLAEYNSRVWLVGGEDYIDDLLANTLAPHITIEVVRCESQADLQTLWVQLSGTRESIGMPWMIHPGIAARIRRNVPDYAVFFAQWSVLLDADALAVIREAANWAAENPSAPVQLAEYLDPDGPQAMVDLARLRMQLIEDKLVEFGIERARVGRLRRNVADVPAMGQESQRVDIVVAT